MNKPEGNQHGHNDRLTLDLFGESLFTDQRQAPTTRQLLYDATHGTNTGSMDPKDV